MKKLLFINPGHIKSITDVYSYCLYLKDQYDITYIGFEENQYENQFLDINLVYLKGYGNNFINKYLFFKTIVKYNKLYEYDFIFINYFKGVSLLRLFGFKYIFLDIRSSYINNNAVLRYVFNKLIFFETLFFSNITVISEGVKNLLSIPKRSIILPLGANLVNNNNITSGFKLLYIGTFFERNIKNTIIAFSKFIKNSNITNNQLVSYTIIGYGSESEINDIIFTINKYDMNNFVIYKGFIKYPELNFYLQNHNIGISYIPIKDYYNFQPPTKTYEYLMNGLVVIGTRTFENSKIITKENGILINDNIESVYKGIDFIYKNLQYYNTKSIQADSVKYSWQNIINSYLKPLIELNEPK